MIETVYKFQATIALLCTSAFLFTGCGIIGDRSSEYVAADAGQRIVIPEGFSHAQIKSRYPIPEIENNRKLPKKFVLPEPPDATAVLDESPYLVESLNDEVWLKLYTSPGKVWPLLDFFWREYQVNVQSEDIANGKLSTSPISDEDNSRLIDDLKEKADGQQVSGLSFQVELRQGVRRNTAELHLNSSPKNDTSQEELLALNTAVLDLIGSYITSSEIQNRYSLLATDIGTDSRVRLLEDENNLTYLELELSYERAWSEVEQALKSAGLSISDLNRSESVFHLHSIETEPSSSWLDFSSDDESDAPFNYEIRLREEPQGVIRVEVKILNPELDESKHNELVSLVFEHIS